MAGGGVVTEFEEGGNEFLSIGDEEMIFFRMNGFEQGIVTVELLVGEIDRYSLKAWKNGHPLQVVSKEVYVDKWRTKYSYRFLVESRDDEFVLRVMSHSYDNSIILHNIQSTQLVGDGYETWFDLHRIRQQLLDAVMDPSGDADRDGVLNYFEYLLDRDPLSPDMPLSIKMSESGEPLIVSPRKDLLEAAGIELKTTIGTLSVATYDWLASPDFEGIDSSSERRLILPGWESSGSILFYLEFPSEVPSLGEL
ncbi:hypothetical protein VDG1235_4663 [Verrucomicrobiia bacterium DG1235]|nr:hypothetical protein VDG1235_4663 [Verrucomicrobiae bacterium DG1235]